LPEGRERDNLFLAQNIFSDLNVNPSQALFLTTYSPQSSNEMPNPQFGLLPLAFNAERFVIMGVPHLKVENLNMLQSAQACGFQAISNTVVNFFNISIS